MTTRESAVDAQPERSFGWWDMFVHPDEDPRVDVGFVGERATLTGYLNDQRLTFQLKCTGLDAIGMAARSVPPSNLSLLGLLRHLVDVERYWFRMVLAGQDVTRRFRTENNRNADFDDALADDALVEQAWSAWREEISFAERRVAETPDLDAVVRHDDEPLTLREVLVHMIEEYARHNGHADFLRERVDGRVGQ